MKREDEIRELLRVHQDSLKKWEASPTGALVAERLNAAILALQWVLGEVNTVTRENT